MQHHCESDSINLNIFVACFTTCHARLHLYRALDHLGPRALYSDTDSVVFVQRPDDPPIQPPLGDFLGDFTDELDPGDHIVQFCSGGPKNYSYMTARGKTECKVRGFSLNTEGQAQFNYQVLRQNTLDELRTPQAQRRVTPVVQTHSVHRDAKQYQLAPDLVPKTTNWSTTNGSSILTHSTRSRMVTAPKIIKTHFCY